MLIADIGYPKNVYVTCITCIRQFINMVKGKYISAKNRYKKHNL